MRAYTQNKCISLRIDFVGKKPAWAEAASPAPNERAPRPATREKRMNKTTQKNGEWTKKQLGCASLHHSNCKSIQSSWLGSGNVQRLLYSRKPRSRVCSVHVRENNSFPKINKTANRMRLYNELTRHVIIELMYQVGNKFHRALAPNKMWMHEPAEHVHSLSCFVWKICSVPCTESAETGLKRNLCTNWACGEWCLYADKMDYVYENCLPEPPLTATAVDLQSFGIWNVSSARTFSLLI